MRQININRDAHIQKCTLCKSNISEIDRRHVYNNKCFQCLFDILFFLENYDPVEFEAACDYAKKQSERNVKK